MTKSFTGTPERYESPDAQTVSLSERGFLCTSAESSTAPAGFEWDDWED